MKDQEFGIEGLGKMEGVGKGPMGVFRKIGTEKNLFEHDADLPLLFLTLCQLSFIVKTKITTTPYKFL
jgi:hypothetical protein